MGGGTRPRAPAIGDDPSRLSAQVRCACFARAAPPARLKAALGSRAVGASAETSCCRRGSGRGPTPAGSRYWERSKPPFRPSKVCVIRPRRASSALGGKLPAAQVLTKTSCRRGRRTRGPTLPRCRYWEPSALPFPLCKVCVMRPRRATSASGSTPGTCLRGPSGVFERPQAVPAGSAGAGNLAQ